MPRYRHPPRHGCGVAPASKGRPTMPRHHCPPSIVAASPILHSPKSDTSEELQLVWQGRNAVVPRPPLSSWTLPPERLTPQTKETNVVSIIRLSPFSLCVCGRESSFYLCKHPPPSPPLPIIGRPQDQRGRRRLLPPSIPFTPNP